MFEHMFDVIFNQVGKYSAKRERLEVKLDKKCERLDVITLVQVKTQG